MNSPAAQTMRTDFPRPACVAQRLPKGPGKAAQRNRSGFGFASLLSVDRKTSASSFPRKRESSDTPKAVPAALGPRLRGDDGSLRSTPQNTPFSVQPPSVYPSLGWCRATQGFADKGRGLSEPRSGEFRSPRETRVAQGTGRSPAPTQGRLLFDYFFLAKQEKVIRRSTAKNSATNRTHA